MIEKRRQPLTPLNWVATVLMVVSLVGVIVPIGILFVADYIDLWPGEDGWGPAITAGFVVSLALVQNVVAILLFAVSLFRRPDRRNRNWAWSGICALVLIWPTLFVGMTLVG